MESIHPAIAFPEYLGMTLPVSTVSYSVLRWYLNACGSDIELAAQVLNSYLGTVSRLIYHSLIEEDITQEHFEEAAASWEDEVETMYRHVPELALRTTPGFSAIFREIMEIIREMGDIEALRPLWERVSYRGYLLLGYVPRIFEALRMQESTFINTVIQFWFASHQSGQDLMGNHTDGQNDEAWEDFEPAGLTDVGFEPSGPRLDVDDIATKTRYIKNPTCSICRKDSQTEDECGHSTCNICLERLDPNATDESNTPMKVRCGHAHSFHYKCLDSLINGISDFSNLCPNCRVPICERRARRVIAVGSAINDRVDAALAAEDSSTEESEVQEMIGAGEQEDEDVMVLIG
jgi:hypothetical protein